MEQLTATRIPSALVRNLAEVLSGKVAQDMVLKEEIAGHSTQRIAGNAFTIEPYEPS